jgi:hypothetical protein
MPAMVVPRDGETLPSLGLPPHELDELGGQWLASDDLEDE